jgi:peptidoglycan hydrolase CwlO-like protein
MLPVEVAEFYGVKDAGLRADFVSFINGMLGFAETGRRECWGQLCMGMINIQTKLKTLQELKAETDKTEKEKLDKAMALVDRLNAAKKELEEQLKSRNSQIESLKSQIESLKSQIESLKSQTQSGTAPPVPPPPVPDPSNLQLVAVKARPSSTGQRPEAPRAKRTLPEPSDEAQRAKRACPEAIPDSDDEVIPVVVDKPEAVADHRGKSEAEIDLRKKLVAALAENDRLERLNKILQKVETPPVETGVKVRVTQEEMGRLRKHNAELEAKLKLMAEEAFRQVRECSDTLKKNDAEWEQKRSKWEQRAKQTAPIREVTLRDYGVGGGVAAGSIPIPSAFTLTCGTVMDCPVPVRSGYLVSLGTVYQSWIRSPPEAEGTFFATFTCPYSRAITSLTSAEMVSMISNIAAELNLMVLPPLRFQHLVNGNLVDFSIVDQIVIAAMCIKHYRLNSRHVTDQVYVDRGMSTFKLFITENSMDFQMIGTNTSKNWQAYLVDTCSFFHQWTFPVGSDGQRWTTLVGGDADAQ